MGLPLKYQNPASADALLDNTVIDATTTPNTVRESVVVSDAGLDVSPLSKMEVLLSAILKEMRTQNILLRDAFDIRVDIEDDEF